MAQSLEAIWNVLPLPVLIVDQKNQITAINPATEQLLNRSETQVRGSLVQKWIVGDLQIDEVLERTRNGHSAVSVRDAPINVAGKGAEHCRLQIAPFEYGVASAQMGDLLLVLQPNQNFMDLGFNPAKSAAKSAVGMAEMLAHEIKNPLAGISGAAQLLAMTIPKHDHELTDMIVSETRRISKLLDQVEQFGNLLPPKRLAVNLHDILDRSRKSALLGFASDIVINDEYDPSLPDAFCDGDQVQQIFLNLLKNAAEALSATPDAQIQVRTRYESGLRVRDGHGHLHHAPLQVDICDNGPGLPPGIADAIFDPFVSGRENGTGLGLALVSKIIADHGGRVGVKSQPGRTVFTVSLPAVGKDAKVN